MLIRVILERNLIYMLIRLFLEIHGACEYVIREEIRGEIREEIRGAVEIRGADRGAVEIREEITEYGVDNPI